MSATGRDSIIRFDTGSYTPPKTQLPTHVSMRFLVEQFAMQCYSSASLLNNFVWFSSERMKKPRIVSDRWLKTKGNKVGRGQLVMLWRLHGYVNVLNDKSNTWDMCLCIRLFQLPWIKSFKWCCASTAKLTDSFLVALIYERLSPPYFCGANFWDPALQ